MDKDKLIGMIIKKETYKNTKPVLNDIQRKKEYKFIHVGKPSTFPFQPSSIFSRMTTMLRPNSTQFG